MKFTEFVDRKQRESRKHLEMVEKLLKANGFQVEGYLDDDDDPYVFVHSPKDKLSFDGVRVYEIGSTMAYRVQRETATHPYGKAYMLNLDDMFNDYMADGGKPEEAGQKVIESVVRELTKFFKKSQEAESDLQNQDNDRDGMGRIVMNTGASDYGALISSKI